MDSEDGELFIKVRLSPLHSILTEFFATPELGNEADFARLLATGHFCAHTRKSLGQRLTTTQTKCTPTRCLAKRILGGYEWPRFADRPRTTRYIRSILDKWPCLRPVIWISQLHVPIG